MMNMFFTFLYAFVDPVGESEEADGTDDQENKLPWEGTDRDYMYEEVYNIVEYK